MANLIASTTAASTSSDIVLTGTTAFTVIGALAEGEYIYIEKKNSDSTYSPLREESGDGRIKEAWISRNRSSCTITPPAGGITVRVRKPATVTAAGVDQD